MLSRLLCLVPVGLLMAQPAPDPRDIARKALDLLLAAQYSGLVQNFTPEVKLGVNEQTLPKMGMQIKSWGAVEKIGEPSTRKAGLNTIVVIPVAFASQSINFQFAINPAGQVAQFFMLPVAGGGAWQRPPYSKPDAFREREVTIGEDPWKLAGTLTVPVGQGPFPAIVLVHGSGPNDRDETIGATKVFKDLAEGLASRGVVVLRYEKRTRRYPTVSKTAKFTIQQETVEDAVKAAALVRPQPEVNPQRVFLLGHGMGGYIAPEIAEDDGKLAGLVLLAANARPLEDLVVEQASNAGFPAKELDTIKAQAARIKRLEPGDEDAPPVLNMPVSYFLDLKGYDAVATAKKFSAPILILQGERDFQVTMKDLDLWKAGLAARKDVTFHSYPALNYLMVAGEGKGTEAEYRKPGHVAPEVIDDIVKWMGK
ncbi:MAG: alpha/beta hydrolase [Acidobacteriia bacterium]|nr:alpha/beta hydrolase [Terriglobia bacterium]